MIERITVKQAVLSTLAYFELFEVPVSRAELADTLLFLEPEERALDLYLKDSSYVHIRDGQLSTRADEDFWNEWAVKQERARDYFKKVARWRWIFSLCPFVRLTCVCNSLPISDVREDSDIDVFVVTQPGHLFTSRLFLTVLTSLFGVRRHGRKVRARFCLSFYVTEEALDLSGLALRDSDGAVFDPYLAFWMRSLEPIAGSYAVYEQLLEKNRYWLSAYFKSDVKRKRYFRTRQGVLALAHRFFEWILRSDRVERWCREQQWGRALEKYQKLADKSGTVISDQMLKFHDHDARQEVREEWKRKVERMG